MEGGGSSLAPFQAPSIFHPAIPASSPPWHSSQVSVRIDVVHENPLPVHHRGR